MDDLICKMENIVLDPSKRRETGLTYKGPVDKEQLRRFGHGAGILQNEAYIALTQKNDYQIVHDFLDLESLLDAILLEL